MYLSILADDDNDYIGGNGDVKVKGRGARSGLVYVTWTVRKHSNTRGAVTVLLIN